MLSAGKGRAGSSALVPRSGAQVPAALRCLLLLPHLEAGEQFDQPDIPLLGQEQEEEAQADDDDGNDPDPVEDDLTGVVIHPCRDTGTGYSAGSQAGPGQVGPPGRPSGRLLDTEPSSPRFCSSRQGLPVANFTL